MDIARSDAPNLPSTEPDSRVSPLMAQYAEVKAAHPGCLLFYRMGDFYELFFADAEIASAALGIVLTKRGKHLGRDIPMCGVPIEPGRGVSAQIDCSRSQGGGVRAA